MDDQVMKQATEIERLQAEINQMTLLRDQDLEGRLKELSELRATYLSFKEEATRIRQELQSKVEEYEKTLLVIRRQ
jgi:seryl-tRNA synthetase